MPNFPFLITDEVIRKCGENSEYPDMLVFGVEEYWAVYAWKDASPKMDWWDVYIVEGAELIVQFDVPIRQATPFAYNIYAAPIMSSMRRHPGRDHFTSSKCRHPLWGKFRLRRGAIPHQWYMNAGVAHNPEKAAGGKGYKVPL